jgi:L-lactate dehydrogenase complex protein LldG
LVSLLPPVHIAVLRSSQIVASLDEAITNLSSRRTNQADAWRSATFITGPSRTGDVELTLSIGVHGPKELHVIILE